MRKTIILMLSVALLAGCAKQLSLSSQPQLENECVYTPAQTQFTFWSNVAEQMEVRIYDETNEPQVLPLTKGENDFWTATVEGDLAGKYYTVRSFQNGEWSAESPGIFAKAVSVNGQRAAILDLNATNPEGWESECARLYYVAQLRHRQQR